MRGRRNKREVHCTAIATEIGTTHTTHNTHFTLRRMTHRDRDGEVTTQREHTRLERLELRVPRLPGLRERQDRKRWVCVAGRDCTCEHRAVLPTRTPRRSLAPQPAPNSRTSCSAPRAASSSARYCSSVSVPAAGCAAETVGEASGEARYNHEQVACVTRQHASGSPPRHGMTRATCTTWDRRRRLSKSPAHHYLLLLHRVMHVRDCRPQRVNIRGNGRAPRRLRVDARAEHGRDVLVQQARVVGALAGLDAQRVPDHGELRRRIVRKRLEGGRHFARAAAQCVRGCCRVANDANDHIIRKRISTPHVHSSHARSHAFPWRPRCATWRSSRSLPPQRRCGGFCRAVRPLPPPSATLPL